jgi:hypothetical protein
MGYPLDSQIPHNKVAKKAVSNQHSADSLFANVVGEWLRF